MDRSDGVGRKGKALLVAMLGGAAGCLIDAGCAVAECVPPDNVPLCLFGTTTAPDYAVALVQPPGDTDVLRLRPQDKVLGWTVAKIGPTYIVLARDRQSLRLDLSSEAAGYVAPEVKRGPMKRVRLPEGQRPAGRPH